MGGSIATMPRPRTGHIHRTATQLGTSFGLRFSWRGRRVYHHFGGSWEGWTEARVERERVYVMAQVERGEYVPQPQQPPSPARVEALPTFQVFASIALARWRRRLAAKTAKDLEWRLRTAMDQFGPLRLDEITVGTVDEFVE